ncbi:MAG: hypothetical protein A2Y10_08510 [Planctomycetes bacterium GWF2_41_51]|nr:MAG: hypothetical protein A2Y10_08510 [Planctomycetes bacterium GWF2_41_51]HBG27079.1 hypothetical protein [Phycisphaerales bacterium]
MIFLTVFLRILQALASMASLSAFFRKYNDPGESPFVAVPIDDLIPNLSSPLNVVPDLVERPFQKNVTPGLHIFLGLPGVGKTREAAAYVQTLASMSGAKIVYLAKGYINQIAPLPNQKEVKRIIVLIDDYDYGFEPATSNSYIDRETAYLYAISNLKKLYQNLLSKTDLHALVVTINQHKLPVNVSDIHNIIPKCSVLVIPSVNQDEFKKFIAVTTQALKKSISNDAIELLTRNCDGRFDTVATFLSSYKGSTISKHDISNFDNNLSTIWMLFQNNLSTEQKKVYTNIKILKDFKLPPRIEYIKTLLELDGIFWNQEEIKKLVASIWPIKNSQVLIYDGQFSVPEYTEESKQKVISMILKSSHFRHKERYLFQEETKSVASILAENHSTQLHLRMLRKLCKWYPHDRYFAYLLALAYKTQGLYLRGMLTLYKIFKQNDVREMVFGKWIGIKMHLLFADLLIGADKNSKRHWKRFKYIENEFKRAELLADANFPDFSIKDYGEPIQLKGIPEPNVNLREILDNEHKELGYDIPETISIDKKYLCAMVHHKYALYLLEEIHREYDAIKQEEMVINLLPEYGEAYLNCATAYSHIGDTQHALYYVQQAALRSPKHTNPSFYEYMTAYLYFALFYDLGDILKAKQWFDKCSELVNKKPLSEHSDFKIQLENYNNTKEWEDTKQFALLRQKEFGEKFIYKIPSFNIDLCFPKDWKIDREDFSGGNLIVIFAPASITWNENIQCPNDASITLVYNTQNKVTSIIEAIESELLKSTKKFGKVEKKLVEGPKSINTFIFRNWSFKIVSSWPKEGNLLTFISPTYVIQIHIMYQSCGKQVFEPILTPIIEAFAQKLLYDPNWKLKT